MIRPGNRESVEFDSPVYTSLVLCRVAVLIYYLEDGAYTRRGRSRTDRALGRVPIAPCRIEDSFKSKPFPGKTTLYFLPPFSPEENALGGKKKIIYLCPGNKYTILEICIKRTMAVRNEAKSN